MESKTVENRKIVRRAFCSLVKLQTVKRGKVLCVKLSARNEKQNSQAPKTCRKSLFAKPLCLALTSRKYTQGGIWPLNFLNSIVFKFTTFLSTKHRNPTCGYLSVVGRILVRQNIQLPFQYNLFRQRSRPSPQCSSLSTGCCTKIVVFNRWTCCEKQSF